ncbi:hypothetical protein G6F56_004197 [Rhizopus delemar]|nr:hypothetical protein G6F56_004197 [Rhizopus delemar]
MSNNEQQVRSKYFTIDSYFKTTKLTQSGQHSVTNVKATTELCPVCNTAIYTESVSMEVHINNCLDGQETSIPSLDSDTKEDSSLSSFSSLATEMTESCSFSVPATKDDLLPPSSMIKAQPSKGKENEEKEKRILPSSCWKSLFSANVPVQRDILAPKNTNNFKSNFLAKSKKGGKSKPCPFYKRVKDTRFVVDAFNCGEISDCDGYFLSHFHSDHYGGLRASWTHGTIYCSKVTANLVKQELRVDSRYIHVLPMNELYPIPQSNVKVALIDANHCPGSVLFLFVVERPDKTVVRHLHTGDFRASPRMCLHPLLRQPENPPIQCLYLDTTYLKPQYAFPAQEECIQAVCEAVEKEVCIEKKKSTLNGWLSQTGSNAFNRIMQPKPKKQTLVVVGTYTVGKERVFFNIAKLLNAKIYAPKKKYNILLCLEDEELKSMLTENPVEAQVHVVSLRDIRADTMANYLWDQKEYFDSLIAFKPTGWTYKSNNVETTNMTLASLSDIITPPSDRSLNLTPYYDSRGVKIFGVPYSEHSSFRELASFIASIDIREIIPTVDTMQKEKQLFITNQWQQDKMAKRTEVVPYSNENYW